MQTALKIRNQAFLFFYKTNNKLQDNRHNNRCGHADEGHPRPAEDAAEDRGYAKHGNALDKHEACHAAKHSDNHNPGA